MIQTCLESCSPRRNDATTIATCRRSSSSSSFPSSHRGEIGRQTGLLAFLIGLLISGLAVAAETIPPAPRAYFNDNAGVVSSGTARELNGRLEQFERETSNQLVVAIYPTMQSDTSIEDYTQRVAEAWKVGQKQRDNGAVLFVFVQDRAMFLQVGYGLEGALPDALAKNIIDTEIIPRIRANDWDGAMRAGVDSVIAATKGEYKGTGRTVGGGRGAPTGGRGSGFCLFIGIMLFFIIMGSLNRSRGYGYRGGVMGPLIIGGMLGSRGRGGGWGGGFGGGGGGGFGGFGGGGGGFGGGGAGGRW